MIGGLKRFSIFISLLGPVIALLSCQKDKEDPLFILRSPAETGIDFANTITENDSINLLDYEYVYNGGGVAVIDVNVDGLPDLFFSGNMVPSRLYLNLGHLRFTDISESAGIYARNWATGAAVADINVDGYPDLYVCSAGNYRDYKRANLLYINNGDNTFTESAKVYGLADTGFSTMAAFLDYDRDGDLDLYVLTYANETWDTNIIYPKVTDGSGEATDKLYKNNGDGTFTNVSFEAGIRTEGYGLGVAVCDINEDGWPDIYVSNDYIDDDFLYINNKDGTFSDRAASYLNHVSHFAMGNDVADFNNDGLVDIMVVDMEPEDYKRQKLFSMSKNYEKFEMGLRMGYLPAYMRNTLQLNNGNGSFSEIGQLAGVHQTDWSWAPLFADLDNDGYKDLFITNGYPKDIMNRDFLVYNKYSPSFESVRNPPPLEEQHRFRLQAITELHGTKVSNYLYKNNGDLTFTKISEAWGIDQPSFSNGAAYADLDRDGDLDLVVNNINDSAFIYENRADKSRKNNYLQIELVGDSLNRSALGAVVKLYRGKNDVQLQQQSPYRGFQSTVQCLLHFGMGTSTVADSIVIRWPDAKYTVLKNINANQLITVNYRHATVRQTGKQLAKPPIFQSATAQLRINYIHKEPAYNDFKTQPLLPHKLSQNGPGITVADINGDGLSDFYVGGCQQFPGALYFQRADGTFDSETFKSRGGEDLGALFFDADNDGDQDLYVASGGNEHMAGTSYYHDHLYINDGDGNLTLDPDALPPQMSGSGSGVTAADWDMDGDLDLFVGGRNQPGNYPFPGVSVWLRNDKGKFSDVTSEVAGKQLERIGMVTCALWTDYNNDDQPDMILAGEWMPITILRNENGRFSNVTRTLGLHSYTGWWNSIVSGDFDNDGDTDYVFGNAGKNTRYKPTKAEPVSIYAKDFDGNGKPEALLTYYINGKEQTVHTRDEITDQVNFMKKRFPTYEAFASADFASLLTTEELKGAYTLRCETFESVYMENDGGKFVISALPIEAQFAPLFGMSAIDVDSDGNLDIVAVGNSYAAELSIGRHDASFGLFLKGDGKGNFTTVSYNESGFFLKGDSKGVSTLRDGRNRLVVLVTNNGGPLEAFRTSAAGKILRAEPADAWAEIKMSDGSIRKQDIQYGTTYISHSDRVVVLPKNALEVRFVTFTGEERIVRHW